MLLSGGILISSLFLHLNMSPNVVSATSATSGFFVSFAILFQNFGNDFPVEYSFWLLFLGISGGSCGRYLALHVVEKYNRQSFITYCLVVFCCIAMLLLVAQAAIASDTLNFKGFCSNR
jgi:uncharacterized membrane protein YfcA